MIKEWKWKEKTWWKECNREETSLQVGNDPLVAGYLGVWLLGVLLEQQQRLLMQIPRVVEDD